MEGAEPATSAAKACPGGIWTAHVAPNSGMRRIASYHCIEKQNAGPLHPQPKRATDLDQCVGHRGQRPVPGTAVEQVAQPTTDDRQAAHRPRQICGRQQ